MLAKRTLVAIVLLPIGIGLILLGGIAYDAVIALVLVLAAWEFVNLMHAGGLNPSRVLVILGVVALALSRAWSGFESTPWLISLIVLVNITYHLLDFERGRAISGTDFGASLAGIFYLGWLGAYLISLRKLPEGEWWLLVALPSVWFADSGAYFIGSRFGRHKLAPRLSPKKTWEGYWGGVIFGVLGGALLGWAFGAVSQTGISFEIGSFLSRVPRVSHINMLNGALIGLALGLLTTLGDLAESMFAGSWRRL